MLFTNAGRIIRNFAGAAVLVLAGCAVQVSENQLLRPVSGGALTQEAVAAATPAYTVTRHDIAMSDGVKLHAVHLRQPSATATVLYFGGNAYTIGRFGALTARVFAPLGVNLVIVDHRGYGLSEGKPTSDLIQNDGIAAFDYLTRLAGPDTARVIVHGQSLGSFIAGHVAAHRPTSGVVLESSITTTEDWAKARMSSAARTFVTVGIDEALKGRGNLRNVAQIEEPLLLLVGGADTVTPPSLSQKLYEASPLPADRKFLTIVGGAGHNDVLLKPEALAAYRKFLLTTS
jgi:alpha-beta hydrolase superfamily lysophospholipase